MARTKNPKSKLSFGGLGLTKAEDVKLERLLGKADRSLANLKRELIRDWMDNQK